MVLIDKVRKKSGLDDWLDDLTPLSASIRESSDERRIRQAVDSLSGELRLYSGRIKLAQEQLVRSTVKHTQAEAVVKTAQMFAHDVRVPFQTLENGLRLLTSDPMDKDKLDYLIGDVRAATDDVDGLIHDLMESGRSLVEKKHQYCPPLSPNHFPLDHL